MLTRSIQHQSSSTFPISYIITVDMLNLVHHVTYDIVVEVGSRWSLWASWVFVVILELDHDGIDDGDEDDEQPAPIRLPLCRLI